MRLKSSYAFYVDSYTETLGRVEGKKTVDDELEKNQKYD